LKYLIGVDLGQLQDPSAISVIEMVRTIQKRGDLPYAMLNDPDLMLTSYRLIHLDSPPLRTPYGEIIARVKKLWNHPNLHMQSVVVVDQTGLGGPIVEQMRDEGLEPVGISITSGQNVLEKITGYSVPKKDIVAVLQVLLENGRFEYTAKLKLAAEFEKQMERFRVKIGKSGRESYGADTEADHDDIVISVALPVWYAERAEGRPQPLPGKEEKVAEYNPFDYGVK
jgi:hypothetical protein